MRRLGVSVLCAAGVAGLVAPISGSLGGASSATAVNGRIAFEGHDRSGRSEIWTMNQDGSDLRLIGPGSDPGWSPDGSRIVLVSPENRIVLVRPDGSDPRVVEIVDKPFVANPALSPDGGMIAFDGDHGLYVVPSGGGAAKQLADTWGIVSPTWSPDGSRIAFLEAGNPTYRRDGHLYVIGADGSGLTELLSVRSPRGEQAAWTPDGSAIAYGDAYGGISTVRLDGSAPRTLIPNTGLIAYDPAWSPDGKRLTYVGNTTDVCVANADGTGLGRLTYTPNPGGGWSGGSTDPAWQPLPVGSAPAGEAVPPDGPPASWNRNRAWWTACTVPSYSGRTLTASVDRVRARVGDNVTYRFRLANRGDTPIGDDAQAAFFARIDGGAQILSVATPRGSCRVQSAVWVFPVGVECRFGSLFPGEHVDVTVRTRATAPGEQKLQGYFPLPPVETHARLRPVLLRRTRINGCTIRGTAHADTLSGSPGNDTICGLDGNDRIQPGTGEDHIYAGPGADLILTRDGQPDHVSCGSGLDTVRADLRDRIATDCERVERP